MGARRTPQRSLLAAPLRRGPCSRGSGRHRHPGRQGRRGPDGEDLESEAVPWTVAWNNSNLRHLDEWAKREDTTSPSLEALWTAQACCPTEMEQLVLQPDFAKSGKLLE